MILREIRKLLQLSGTSSIEGLQSVRCFLFKTGLDRHEFIFCQLVLSAVSVSLRDARDILDSSPIKPPPLFAWNTLMRAYSWSSVPGETIKLFVALLRTATALRPDNFTFPFVIKGCGRCSMIGCGGSIHSMVVKTGFSSSLNVNNTLLALYALCGVIGFAVRVFDEMRERDVVSWTSLIAAYVGCGRDLDALRVFTDMKVANQKPNSATLVSLLSACTNLHEVSLGKCIHSYVIITAVEFHVSLGTALLHMYAKSGHLQEALHIFRRIPAKNLQCWTIMISCLADHGCGEEALYFFNQMEESGLLRPDSMSFSAVLSACSHTGLVNEGRELFNKMVSVYRIEPTIEHYGCMVDLFCRAGRIEEAYEMLVSMPIETNSVMLRSYLNSCKRHGASEYLDENLVKLLLTMEPGVGANYVLAAKVCSGDGAWDGVDRVRRDMRLKGVKKVPGWSSVQGCP